MILETKKLSTKSDYLSAMQFIQKRGEEWCYMPVCCIFTILLEFIISEVDHCSSQTFFILFFFLFMSIFGFIFPLCVT